MICGLNNRKNLIDKVFDIVYIVVVGRWPQSPPITFCMGDLVMRFRHWLVWCILAVWAVCLGAYVFFGDYSKCDCVGQINEADVTIRFFEDSDCRGKLVLKSREASNGTVGY